MPDHVSPIRPRRSALYMPASNPRAVQKARELSCDVVILDLEDAVAPEQKVAARVAAMEAVRAGGFGQRELVVRANALDTEWGADDLAALRGGGADAVLLPKVSAIDTLHAAREALGDGPALWAMVETARGVVNLPDIVDAAREVGLAALVVGTNDLAKELRCRPGSDRAPLLPILTQIVLAARMAGLIALDGVINVLDDEERIAAECAQGLEWGFDGKTLIHPAQIAPANRVFSPAAEEIGWAEKIVHAFEQPDHANRGAIRIDGKMVERLHLDGARRTLALHQAIQARQ
ncbi:citrate lyase subunit beta / citryl-CoA lyase [Sphingomonas palmae]|uniref:Citrate lyase subunit beta / citryl-CoA lyase n=1 Tax=Sphingomonas palmae TaxID=1855283 RepID=A0A1H7T1N5_9SPHN|nr:CoA ester lyase [Sphingomonas palmae]SEL78164.1 citrate lyase subunit beta / citryl-CoA lyase [Sphingomonas palmae]